MNPHSDDSTSRYYDDRAEEYIARTDHLNMERLYAPFLELVPDGGAILDAGCGPGRDVEAFLNRGYQVTAIDASAKMTALATERTGVAAMQVRFQDLAHNQVFDGIWACASLLHLPSNELDAVLDKLRQALRIGGICFMSFKQGPGERIEEGRQFLDFTESSLRDRLCRIVGLSILSIWVTDDLAGRADTTWVNALVKREN